MINLNPFINLISSILSLYTICLIVYVVMHYLFLFKVINPYNQFVQQVNRFLVRILEPVLGKIRNYIPSINGIDLSVLVLFLGIYFVRDILYTYFYVY